MTEPEKVQAILDKFMIAVEVSKEEMSQGKKNLEGHISVTERKLDAARTELLDMLNYKDKNARTDEIAMFFKQFGQEESIGSTPSDLIAPEYWLNGDPENYMAYFDKRLEELTQ